MATKKANKAIVTPIDQKETFVSASKVMNESDGISMEEKLHTLYKIQQTDTNIDQIHLERGELPLEVQELEDDIEGLKTRIANIQAEIKESDKKVADNKTKIEESKHSVEKYEEQRNNVKNNREYESLSKEIEFQELDQQASAKKIKDTTLLITEKKELLDETKKELSEREIDLSDKKKELDSIIEETSKQEEVLVKHKAELVKKIDERMLAAYERVRDNAKNHLAVVTVSRGACGGCFNKIPSQKEIDIEMGKKVIICEYCGRILVSPDFEKEEESK